MEIRQHRLADKTLNKALSTFADAVSQVNKAIELKEASIEIDEMEMTRIEGEIGRLELLLDDLQAGIITKKGEIKQHKELANRLQAFTVGGI